MLRIEIVANHSVEENLLEAFAKENVGKYYTKYPNVYGVGSTGPRMGDAIWPEVNFSLIIWCEEEEARGLERAVAHVKEHFPDEGIKIFGLSESLSEVIDRGSPHEQITPAAPPQTVRVIHAPVHATEVPVTAAAGLASRADRQQSPQPVPAYPPRPAPVASAHLYVPPHSAPAAPVQPYTPPPAPVVPAPAYTPPSTPLTPPVPGHVETEYDGQNMDEEH